MHLITGLIHLIRPKQWIKNSFVLAPLLFTSFTSNLLCLHALFATLAFCLASSAAYIINDIRDREFDKKHVTKSKSRPIAAGIVSVSQAILLLIFLYLLLFAYAFIAFKVFCVLVIYMLMNLAYSFGLKNQPVFDIFIIALGFVLRVYAGAVALSVPVSGWMLITTLSLALYLGSIKRRQEIHLHVQQSREVLSKYTLSLVDKYAQMSATCALLFYSMYVLSAKPQLLYTIPIVLFGLFRYWYVVEKLEGGESPTDVLFHDLILLLTVVTWIVACGVSLY